MTIKDTGFGVLIEVKETKTLGKILIIDNILPNNYWNRERQIL